MSAITIQDLNNAKSDVDTIAAVATSSAPTVIDRLGNQKLTVAGAITRIAAITSRGNWATATNYSGLDVVKSGSDWWICLAPHTSGATFAGDQAAYWRIYQGSGMQQAATGTVSRTLADKAADVWTAADFDCAGDDSSDDTTKLTAAILGVPAGAKLELKGRVGDVFLTSNVSVVRSNITIVGARCPRENAGITALEGGTIIRGQLLIDGDNVRLENFGCDYGIDYSNAYKSGAGGNGLVVHNTTLTVIRKNIHVSGVCGLARVGDYTDATAAFHGVLLEGLDGGSSRNVRGVGGWFGVVLKVSNWEFSGLTGVANDTTAVYIKSNSYGPVTGVTGSNVRAIAGGSRMYVGFMVQASNAPLKDVTVHGVYVSGGSTGAGVRVEGETTQTVEGVEITGMVIADPSVGCDFRGSVYASSMQGTVRGPTSGLGCAVRPNTVPVSPNDVTIDLRVNLNTAQAAANAIDVQTATRVFLKRAHCTVNYSTPAKINVTSATVVGDVFGVLSCDRTEANLLNGWAVFAAGQPCGTQTRFGQTVGYGRIAAGAATSDVFMQLPAGAYPAATAFMASMMGYVGGKPTPVYVAVDASGNCSVSPNRAAYTVSYFDLTTLRIPARMPFSSGPF